MNQARIEIALRYIEGYAGLPYRWGGDDPIGGIDCSGLQVEYLKALGVLGEREDFSAAELYKRLKPSAIPERGNLIFFLGKDGAISHGEILLGEGLSIGARGGDHLTLTPDDAIRRNAFVKVRPYSGSMMIAGIREPALTE